LAQAGLTARLPENLSDADLVARFGDAARQYIRSCRLDHCDNVEDHALMSANLDMALTIRSQIWGDRFEALLSWFTTANLPRPGRILDIGCDIGLQTCFYAMFFPDSQVTGIDQCAKSIQCAQRLAERMRLKNVGFLPATLPDLPDNLVNQKFDLVVSSCIAGHFYDEPTIPVRSVEEAHSQPLSQRLMEYARLLGGFLADENSLLVAFDRFQIPTVLARWIWALRDAGIYVDRDRIELLEFVDESEDSVYAPVMAGTRRTAELITPDEIRELWMEGFLQHGGDVAFRHAAAEYFFVSESPKELLKGYRCMPPGLPPYCKEIWKSGSDVLIYLYEDGGVMIDAAPVEDLPKILDALRISARENRVGWSVEEYGPEAYPQPHAAPIDRNAADRPTEETPDSATATESDDPDA